MAIYEIKFRDSKELADSLHAIGADMRSLPFFDNRRRSGPYTFPASMSEPRM